MKVLFVQSLAGDGDRETVDQLREASAELQVTTIAGSAAALAELRRTPGWQALFASPALAKNEVLAMIASLRRDKIPIAIVPILDDAHQDLFASAVATGADDVLVSRGGSLVNVNETLTRIRQSPHLFPAEQRRRISVLYAGRDPLVWNLLDQVPFAKADRATVGIDGTCPVRRSGTGDDTMRVDAVIIDEAPGDAHPLQVLKSVKAQASDLPVIMLTSAGAADIATAALELGADDTVLKAGIFRRRLIATLRRVHQRLELSTQQQETKTREERLRQIVENVPTGIMVVAGDGRVLAMNATALQLFGATKSRDLVGRDFRELVAEGDRQAFTGLLHSVTRGEAAGLTFGGLGLGGTPIELRLDAVMLERDARGGRGVVASIARVDAPAGNADGGAGAMELAALRDSVQTLERHHAELEDARAAERAAWESDRQQLEARLEEAERLAAERRAIQDRLDEVTAELARTSQSFVAERQALERRLEELDDAVREASTAGAGRADLERELDAVREAQRQAIADHALERSGWEDIRGELEARVQQLDALSQPDHDRIVGALRDDIQRLELTLADDRTRWEATRDQLETELRNAREALWAEHTERDTARATFEAEVETLRATLEAERRAWDEARAALTRELEERRNSAGADTAGLDRQRDELERRLHELEASFEAERAAWSDTRRSLEREAADQRDRIELVELERDRVRQSLEERSDNVAATLEAERRDWLQREQTLQQDLANACSAVDTSAAERDQMRRDLDDLRGHLERDVARLEGEAADLRAALETATREGDDLRTALDAATGERDDLRTTLDATASERDTFQNQLAEATSRLEALRAERDEWQPRIAALESSLAAAAEDAARREAVWQDEREHLEREALDTRRLADQERGHLVSLHAREAEEWRQAVDRARSERDLAHDRLAAAEATLAEAQDQLAELDEMRSTLPAALADLETARQRVSDLELRLAEVSNAAAQHQQLTDALEAARNELGQTDAARRADREAWTERQRALESELRDVNAALTTERRGRETLESRLSSLEAEAARAAHLAREQKLLSATITSVQAENEALSAAVSEARAERDHDRQALEALRSDLADARRGTDEQAASTNRFVQEAARHAAKERALEAEVNRLSARLVAAAAETDAVRSRLEALRTSAAAAEARLRSSSAFGYAHTSMSGELVSCNDTFAQMLGYADAADARARSAGRPFPGLSSRPDIAARLAAAGHVDHVVTCLNRIDGQPVRVTESLTLLANHDDADRSVVEHIVVPGPAAPTADELFRQRLQEVGALTAAMVPELEALVGTLAPGSPAQARSSDRSAPTDAATLRATGDRLAALISQLAGFSRRQMQTPTPADLGQVVGEAEPILARLVGDYVHYSSDVAPADSVPAQRADLEQLVTSLVTLGRDLLPVGGSLQLQVRQDAAPETAGPVVAVIARGYGVQVPASLPSLELMAKRCGGSVNVEGSAGQSVQVAVRFPRCAPEGH